jgi:integrase
LYPEKSRRRFLQADEMVRFEAALKTEPSQDLKDFLALSMATGARKSDVLSMRWQDIQWERKNWCVPFPKNAESYNASLEDAEIAILERRRKEVPDSSPWVFPGRAKSGHMENVRKPWLAFRKRANIHDIKIHDLRRTVGSWQAIAGESLQKIGQSLGHKSPRSTQVYAHLVDEAVRESKAAGAAKMQQLMADARKRAKILKKSKVFTDSTKRNKLP